MPDYKQMYFTIFNAVTDALKKLESQNYGDAAVLLRKSQQVTEETYINEKDEE